MTNHNIPDTVDVLDLRLQSLAIMDYADLHQTWKRLYRSTPPRRMSRDILILGLGWKLQVQGRGGLDPATRRHMARLIKTLTQGGDVTRSRVARLKPGARLLREWHGVTHTVTILEEGFEWQGQIWTSLTAIARKITGGHWSGPRFFGLRTSKGSSDG